MNRGIGIKRSMVSEAESSRRRRVEAAKSRGGGERRADEAEHTQGRRCYDSVRSSERGSNIACIAKQ